jgi:hypothetical protein
MISITANAIIIVAILQTPECNFDNLPCNPAHHVLSVTCMSPVTYREYLGSVRPKGTPPAHLYLGCLYYLFALHSSASFLVFYH